MLSVTGDRVLTDELEELIDRVLTDRRETAKSGVDDAAFFLATVGDAAVGGMVPQSSALVDRCGGSDSLIYPRGVWSSQSAPCPGGTDRAVQRRKSAPA